MLGSIDQQKKGDEYNSDMRSPAFFIILLLICLQNVKKAGNRG
jgi:hypothetical protein